VWESALRRGSAARTSRSERHVPWKFIGSRRTRTGCRIYDPGAETVHDISLSTLLRPTLLLLVLPVSHLVLCLAVQVNATLGSWSWFPVFLIDFPFSFLLIRIEFLPPIVIFGIFGTLWWYVLAIVIRALFTWRAE
jgi:hypothetical protein